MIRSLAAVLALLTGAVATAGTAWAQAEAPPAAVAQPVAEATTPAPSPAPPPTPPPRVDAAFADDGVTITDGGKSVLFYRTAPASRGSAG